MKKICDDLITVDSMNLWPIAEWLVQIERKYSQSLSYQDLNGEEQVKVKKREKKSDDANEASKTIKFM